MTAPASLQDLAPRWARLCLAVDAKLKNLVPDLSGANLVVACSGGVDSTALLHILHIISPRNGFDLHVAHLNHGLRDESAEDSDFVSNLCTKFSIPFHGKLADISAQALTQHVGLEEAGRLARYAFLEEVREQTDSSHILMAHHLDDLMEDQIMRSLRGTGWPALGGMIDHDHDRRLLRPLLYFPKKDLTDFMQANILDWREDKSNTDMRFLRNRVRHGILPMYLEENPSFGSAVRRLHEQAILDASLFRKMTAAIPRRYDGTSIVLEIRNLRDIHQAIRMRLYKQLIDSLGTGQALMDTLLEMDEAVMNAPMPKVLNYQFPGGKTASLKGNTLTFHPAPALD